MAHLHEVRDTDKHYIINPLTMEIESNGNQKNTLQQGDHGSEVYTFELPKEIEKHDMSLCNLVEIHFINISADKADRSEGVYGVHDMKIAEDAADTLLFTWTLKEEATMFAGSVNFRIKFACVDEEGKYTYRKWTKVHKGTIIEEGFDNAESVEKEHSDILSQWEARLDALEEGGIDGAVLTVNGVAPDKAGNVVLDVSAELEEALAKAKESGDFDGEQGIQGEKGDAGEDGSDGVSCTHSWDGTTLSVTSASGTSSANLKGEKGDKGDTGEQGPQGEKGADGAKGDKGDKGDDGKTPEKGVDYWTPDDMNTIKSYIDESLGVIENGSY